MNILEYHKFLESAQDIRNYITTNTKYKEQGKELDSGGKIDDNLSGIFIQILGEIKKDLPTVNVTITSGNDKFHKGIGYTSKHSMGKAIDFVIDPYNRYNADKIKAILDKYAGYFQGFTYLDEYTRPSAASTGGHFHIAYDPANPEGSHARKTTGTPKPAELPSSADSDFLFKFPGFKKNYAADEPGIDTWAGFIKSLERNR